MFRTLALALLIVIPAIAQVDHRVEAGRPVAGAALDASNQIGTGGFNSNLGSQRNLLINSANNIVTGNVSGLGGFRDSSLLGRNSFNVTGLSGLSGSTLISDPSTFQGGLPSGDLSYFNRRGFSLGDTRSAPSGGNAILTPYRPYFDPSQTIVNTGGIQRGLNRPGSSTPRDVSTNPYISPSTGFGNTNPLPTGVADPLDKRLPLVNVMNQPVFTTLQSLPAAPQPYQQAVQSPLFGPSRQDARPSEELLRRLYVARAGDNRPADEPRRTLPPPTESTPREQPTAVAATAEPPSALVGAPPAAADASAPADLGRDLFRDMLATAQKAEQLDPDYLALLRGPTGIQPAETTAAPQRNERLTGLRALAADTAASVGRDGTPGASRRAEFALRLDRAARWAGDLLKQPIRSLSTPNAEDAVNRTMQAGEEALRGGDYFTAASHYTIAASLDPQNPLPLIGRGVSLAAAGSYLSAAQSIGAGINRFPQIVVFELDLVAIAGGRDVFDRRRADLEQQLSRSDSYELRFLLGFLEYYSGQKDAGVANLRKAAAKAPRETIIARFPDLLTGMTR